MSKKIKLTVEMEVTIPQALALQAMFEYWNYLSNIGSSRVVGFYVDGDGNFHPKCNFSTNEPIPDLTKELAEISHLKDQYDKFGNTVVYDFDPIAWALHPPVEQATRDTPIDKDDKAPKTMNDLYKDGSPHTVCTTCGCCITCGDCTTHGCGNNHKCRIGEHE